MTYTLEKAKILIVDDLKPMTALAASILRTFGFKDVYEAGDTDTAFDLLCQHNPDLVITDWMMEPVNGLDFTRKIRRDPVSPNPYVPVLMMTGFSSRIRVESARDMGITEFLVKPFTAKDLYRRVEQIIEKPRQFVDTGTFFGPDRRRKSGDGYEGPMRRGEEEPDGQNDKDAANILKQLQKEAKKISD